MNYISFTKEQFESALKNIISFEEYKTPHNELVYSISTKLSTVKLIVYSSISKTSSKARKSGKDAIRLVLIDKVSDKPCGEKEGRINRVGESFDSIMERLKKRIYDIINEINLTLCPSCKSVMTLREGKFGKFYGCLSYPKCKTIVNINGKVNIKKTEVSDNFEKPNNDLIDIKSYEKEEDNLPVKKTYKFDITTTQVEKIKVIGTEEWLSTSVLKSHLLKYSFEKLNPFQSTITKYMEDDVNIVCAASTSSGKTISAELCMAQVIERGKKAIFLSPLKAVTKEKYEDWTNPKHPFSKLNISIVTGDYKLTDVRKEELQEANIILLTSEMIDARTRLIQYERNFWLKDIGVCVVDEVHTVGLEERGDALEVGMMRFTEINPDCKVVFLSATIPNSTQFAEWLFLLNNKKTILIESSWRPVVLDTHFITYASDKYMPYVEKESNIVAGVIDLIKKYDDKFIVFVHSKNTGKKIHYVLKQMGIKVDFYYADLDKEKRHELDASFRDRENGIKVLISTSGLAYGINMPARRVIVSGVYRGLTEVKTMDLNQMQGRAGRYGIDEKGDAYILLPRDEFDYHKNRILNPSPVISTLNDIHTLAFHIVSEIHNKNIRKRQDITLWYKRSLAMKQGQTLADINEVVTALLGTKTIKEDSEGNLKVTNLGRICVWLYYSPFDVSKLYNNVTMLTLKEGMVQDDPSLIWALTNLPMFDMGYIPKNLEDIVYSSRQLLASKKLSMGSQLIYFTSVYNAIKNNEVNELNLYLRQFRNDMDRFMNMVKLVDSYYASWGLESKWDALSLRIKYGISEELIQLCSIKGIGKVRAEKLYKAGITSIIDIQNNVDRARSIIGHNVVEKIIGPNERLL